MHSTPYLIESTLELLERTGVDLCTHVQYLCMNIVLCSSANCSNKSGDDEVGFGDAFGVKCKIAHYLRKSAKIIGLFFGRYREML